MPAETSAGRRPLGRLRAEARSRLGRDRLAHVRRTASLAARIARRCGLVPTAARRAAWLHDLAREMPPEEIDALAPGDGDSVLRHGRAAAALAVGMGLEDDPGVLEAVREHTLGRPGMGPTARALFAADALDPGRKIRPAFRRAARRRLRAADLDGLVALAIESTRTWLATRGGSVHPLTAALLAETGRDGKP